MMGYETMPLDLITPAMTDETPGPGKRVRQTAPEYRGTDVHHALYLPRDWQPGCKYPVIVEYTGNKWEPCKSTGKVEDATRTTYSSAASLAVLLAPAISALQTMKLQPFGKASSPTTILTANGTGIIQIVIAHPHTDLWMHRESAYRKRARAWLESVLKETHYAQGWSTIFAASPAAKRPKAS